MCSKKIKDSKTNLLRRKLATLLSDHEDQYDTDTSSSRNSIDHTSSSPTSASSLPWSESSPCTKSPWTYQSFHSSSENIQKQKMKYGLIGSLFRQEGHIYSLATSGGLLYTGSDSKNIRVWKGFEEFSGFKSSSGLVKAIVVFNDQIFTCHQDGKIRVWRFSDDKYTRVGSMPTTRDLLMKSVNPRNYIKARRKGNVPWVKHYDAVSCMSIDERNGLLYSGSWDKTLKVWRISNFKCLESVHAHDDAVNSIAVGFDGLVFTGSADGSVKAWRRELIGNCTKHVLVETLLKQEHAVTSLVVSQATEAVYVGTSDGLVNFWEREKHFMTYGGVLRGHKSAVLCLGVAGGDLVVSGSADNSICIWRREDGAVHNCVAVLTGHSSPVKCLAVEKDEKEEGERWIVYSGSLDKSVKVWRVWKRGCSQKQR